jgi:hypothetical protein
VLAAASDARADGDPASDVLTVQDVYYGVARRPRRRPAGARRRLPFLVPVLLFAGAAGAAMVVSRRRRPAGDA